MAVPGTRGFTRAAPLAYPGSALRLLKPKPRGEETRRRGPVPSELRIVRVPSPDIIHFVHSHSADLGAV